MNKPTFKKSRFFLLFTALFGLPAVLFGPFTVAAYAGQDGVVATYKSAVAPFEGDKSPDMVLPVPVDTVLVKTKYQGGVFRTQTRKDKMGRFQCSFCHNNKEVTRVNAAKEAHGDIDLVHGGREKPLDCYTCHSKEQRDFLRNDKGEKVDMDHSYLVCARCHFRQKKDWTGGAHGKRIAFWAGERVVANCASCHDPHSPLFKKRWPGTYSLPLTNAHP